MAEYIVREASYPGRTLTLETIGELVRCRDCKYASLTYDGDCKYCSRWDEEYEESTSLYLDGDFYCGFAERRTDA